MFCTRAGKEKPTDGFKDIKAQEHGGQNRSWSTSPRSAPHPAPSPPPTPKPWMRSGLSSVRPEKPRPMRYKPGFFSFNTAGGRCERMQGGRAADRGDAVSLGCGPDLRSLQGQALQERDPGGQIPGKNIDDVLQMSVAGSLAIFSRVPKIEKTHTAHGGGAGVSQTGTAHDDTLGRGTPADQAGLQPGPSKEKNTSSISLTNPPSDSTRMMYPSFFKLSRNWWRKAIPWWLSNTIWT